MVAFLLQELKKKVDYDSDLIVEDFSTGKWLKYKVIRK